VADQAIMVHGGYGYTTEYPVEQILRDIKIAAIYEGTNGIQALDLVGRKLAQKKGQNFASLMGEMYAFLAANEKNKKVGDLVAKLKTAVDTLSEIAGFFATCGKEGKFLVPVGNAYPFLNLIATVLLGWFLAWQAVIASEKLDALATEKGVDPSDWGAWATFMGDNADAAFYSGKVAAAKYFINNILPEVGAIADAIKSEDMSIMEISENSFAF
jgi:hypothetical protein